jgi:hypothetical protein
MNRVKSILINDIHGYHTHATTTTTTMTTPSTTITPKVNFIAILKSKCIEFKVVSLINCKHIWDGVFWGGDNFNSTTKINIEDNKIRNDVFSSLNGDTFNSEHNNNNTTTTTSKNIGKLSDCRLSVMNVIDDDDARLKFQGNYCISNDITLPLSCVLIPLKNDGDKPYELLNVFTHCIRDFVLDIDKLTKDNITLQTALITTEKTLERQQEIIDKRETNMLENFVKVLNGKKKKLRQLKDALNQRINNNSNASDCDDDDNTSTSGNGNGSNCKEKFTKAKRGKKKVRPQKAKRCANSPPKKKQRQAFALNARDKQDNDTDSEDGGYDSDRHFNRIQNTFVFDDDQNTQLLQLESQSSIYSQQMISRQNRKADSNCNKNKETEKYVDNNNKDMLTQEANDFLDDYW